MSIDSDDIRAAVATGLINEEQAVKLTALADARRGARSDLDGLDEPFELFRGFNEIFIVVGLAILFGAWATIAGLPEILSDLGYSFSNTFMPLMGVATSLLLARYFTLRRRMVAPSIFLMLAFAAMVLPMAVNLAWLTSLNYTGRISFAFGFTTVALAGHYLAFRVPITSAAIAIGAYTTVALALLSNGAALPNFQDLIRISDKGPFGWLMLGGALIVLVFALRLDMSDPHRVTRRTRSAFWLHVVAAPALVNTIAQTLLGGDIPYALILLAAFLLLMALFAIIIDRRSFLVAGVGYVVFLIFTLAEDSFAWPILVLGLGLVFLGAQWERIRAVLMGALPDFPGKSRLPPYHLAGSDPAENSL